METFAINLHFIAASIEGFLATPRQSCMQVCRVHFLFAEWYLLPLVFSFNAGDICAHIGFI